MTCFIFWENCSASNIYRILSFQIHRWRQDVNLQKDNTFYLDLSDYSDNVASTVGARGIMLWFLFSQVGELSDDSAHFYSNSFVSFPFERHQNTGYYPPSTMPRVCSNFSDNLTCPFFSPIWRLCTGIFFYRESLKQHRKLFVTQNRTSVEEEVVLCTYCSKKSYYISGILSLLTWLPPHFYINVF